MDYIGKLAFNTGDSDLLQEGFFLKDQRAQHWG